MWLEHSILYSESHNIGILVYQIFKITTCLAPPKDEWNNASKIPRLGNESNQLQRILLFKMSEEDFTTFLTHKIEKNQNKRTTRQDKVINAALCSARQLLTSLNSAVVNLHFHAEKN